jgi:hypothetical protein
VCTLVYRNLVRLRPTVVVVILFPGSVVTNQTIQPGLILMSRK